MSPAFQRWAETVDWDHLPWPFSVLVEMPPEQVVPDPGITMPEMLENVIDRMSKGRMAVVPCQGNQDVVMLVAPVNEGCAELYFYSRDSSFSAYLEAKRLLGWLFSVLPYSQYIAATNIPLLKGFLNRLGFVGPIEIPNYHPLGGSWFYYYVTDDTRKKG